MAATLSRSGNSGKIFESAVEADAAIDCLKTDSYLGLAALGVDGYRLCGCFRGISIDPRSYGACIPVDRDAEVSEKVGCRGYTGRCLAIWYRAATASINRADTKAVIRFGEVIVSHVIVDGRRRSDFTERPISVDAGFSLVILIVARFTRVFGRRREGGVGRKSLGGG